MAFSTHPKEPQQRVSSSRNKYYTLSSFFIAFVPLLFSLLFISFVLQSSVLDFYPTFTNAVFNDEFTYWREINTFQEVGFKGGYHVHDELPASAHFTHFGAHGFVFPALYGLLARITGWNLYTGILYNFFFVTISLGLFIYLIKPNRRQSSYLTLLLLTFWPLLFFLPSIMQESLHYSLAILAAGLFFRLLKANNQSQGIALGMCCIVLALAALLRVTWVFLFLPLTLLSSHFVRGKRGRLLQISILILAGLLLAVSFVLVSPYPNFLRTLQLTFSNSVIKAIALLLLHFLMNVAFIFRGNPLEVAQRFQILVMGVLWLAVYRKRRRELNNPHSVEKLPHKLETWFHLLNLGPLVAINILFYDIGFWRDYRVLSVHLLLSLLVLIAFERYAFLKVTLAINLLVLPFFVDAYSFYRGPQFERDTAIAAFETEIQEYIVYNSSDDAWCNTVLVDTPLRMQPMITRLMALPGGVVTCPPETDPDCMLGSDN